jgi:hypothetical protein
MRLLLVIGALTLATVSGLAQQPGGDARVKNALSDAERQREWTLASPLELAVVSEKQTFKVFEHDLPAGNFVVAAACKYASCMEMGLDISDAQRRPLPSRAMTWEVALIQGPEYRRFPLVSFSLSEPARVRTQITMRRCVFDPCWVAVRHFRTTAR